MSATRLLAAAVFGLLLPDVVLHALPVKIACIGDSITFGSGLPNPAADSYPAKLQRLLGTNYVVRNFGISGRTLLKQGDFPYWKERLFSESHDWAPDLVIIQLGTNDSKPYNWRYGTNFVAEYEELVASYMMLASAPRVIACTPCPVYANGAFDIRPGIVATNIVPGVRDVASRLDLGLVDLHARLAGHREWFPDTVHPNAKGMSVMAAVIYSALAGEKPQEPPPSVGARLAPGRRLVLTWPAGWRDTVVQSATSLAGANTRWTVTEQAIYFNGDTISQTNALSGPTRMYRLWQP